MFDVGSIVGHMKLQTQDWKRSVTGVRRDASGLKQNLREIGQAGLQVAKDIRVVSIALSAAVGLAAKSFISAASEAEGYRVRLVGLLGSVDEGTRMFKEMSEYAAKTPFEYREVMASATALSGVMKGGVDQVKAWIPLIGDLAKAANLDLETTTGQVMRMFSAGAASADLFREKGVLSMLGFQAGVQYTAEETQRMLVAAWTDPASKFEGMAMAMAGTWDSQLGMIADKWFQLRLAIMQSGPFDALKSALASLNGFLDAHMGMVEEWIKAHGDLIVALGGTVAAVTGLMAALTALGLILPPLGSAMHAVGVAASVMKAKILLPVAPYLAAIASIVAGLALLGAEIYAIRAAWNQNLGGMRDIGQAWVNTILTIWEVMYKGIAQVINSIGSAWTALWDRTWTGARILGNAILGHFVGLKKSIQAALSLDITDITAPINAYKSAMGVDYLGGVSKGISLVKDQLANVVDDTITLGKATVEALGYWWDFAKDANVKEWSRVLREQVGQDFDAVMAYISENYPTLAKTIGGLFGDALTNEVQESLEADIAAMLGNIQNGDLDSAGGGGAKGSKGRAAKELALADEADTLMADKLQQAHELFANMQPMYVQAMTEMVAQMELLREAGLMDDAMEQNLLAPYFWREWGNLSSEEMDHLLTAFSQISPEADKIAQDMWNMVPPLKEVAETASKMREVWGGVAGMLNETAQGMMDIGEFFGNKLLSKIGAVAGGVGHLINAIFSYQAAMIAAQGTAMAAWMAILGPIYLVVAAVQTVLQVMGMFGDQAVEVKHGWERVLDELADKLDEWADRLTDTIIEFVKTGEFELEKFVQGVLEDTLRVTIRYGMIDPLLGGLFNAQGNAFDSGRLLKYAQGGLVDRPSYFGLKDGRMGVAGEAGPEAILPLRRTPSGDLGVIAQDGKSRPITVNVIDQRTGDVPPVKVDRTTRPDGSEELRILIEGVVNDGLMTGAFDNAGGLAYGWARGR